MYFFTMLIPFVFKEEKYFYIRFEKFKASEIIHFRAGSIDKRTIKVELKRSFF